MSKKNDKHSIEFIRELLKYEGLSPSDLLILRQYNLSKNEDLAIDSGHAILELNRVRRRLLKRYGRLGYIRKI